MTSARDIMHTGMTCISEHDTLTTAAQRMRDLDVGALPIWGDDDSLRGIITDRDIVVKCVAAGQDPSVMTAGDLAQRDIYRIDADADINDVITVMEEHQIRRLPVLNGERLVGMISESDIARHLPDHAVGAFVEAVCAPKALPHL